MRTELRACALKCVGRTDQIQGNIFYLSHSPLKGSNLNYYNFMLNTEFQEIII